MNLKNLKLPISALSAGLLGFFLRLALYRIGFDDKNILSASHPLHQGCLILAAMTAVYLLLKVRSLGGSHDHDDNFPAHPLRALGCFAAGCLIAFHGITLAKNTGSLLDVVRVVLALGSGVCMVLRALVPDQVRPLRIFCHGFICVFFALDMLCRYRGWSGNPQLPDYVFQVFACALLAVTGYHRLAFDTGLGSRRFLLWCSLTGLCLCLFCAAGPETQVFYLGGAIWCGVCMCAIQPPVEEPENSQDLTLSDK